MKTKAITFSAICIVLNLVLGKIADLLTFKVLFLDTMGTVMGAVTLGPIGGAIIGGATNLVLGVISGVDNIPFAIVNIAVGLFVGFVAKDGKFGIIKALITGIILSVLVPLIGTPISLLVYNGVSGSGIDFIYGVLIQSGQKVFTAAFVPRILINIIDKPASCILASIILSKLPKNMISDLRKNNKSQQSISL
nr:CD3073 family putative ECF transporter S component [uncultured Romboutsia sp.]